MDNTNQTEITRSQFKKTAFLFSKTILLKRRAPVLVYKTWLSCSELHFAMSSTGFYVDLSKCFALSLVKVKRGRGPADLHAHMLMVLVFVLHVELCHAVTILVIVCTAQKRALLRNETTVPTTGQCYFVPLI